MDLLELIHSYWSILRTESLISDGHLVVGQGVRKANAFLDGAGIHPEVVKAIQDIFITSDGALKSRKRPVPFFNN